MMLKNKSTVSNYKQFRAQFEHCSNISFIFSFLAIITIARACDINKNIYQKIYVNPNHYCQLNYCTDSSTLSCHYYQCGVFNENCYLLNSFPQQKACSQQCCGNITANQNGINYVAQKYCQNNVATIQSSGIIGVLIMAFIFVIIVGFLVTIIVVVFRRFSCFRNCFKRTGNITANQQNRASTGNSSLGTHQHIAEQNKITSTLADEGPNFVDVSNECVICLDSNVNLKTHCNHYYHTKCLFEWIKKKPGNPCPLCMSLVYNPVKVYCRQCLIGQMLVNFSLRMSQVTIKHIDCILCNQCKKKSVIDKKDDNSRIKMKKDCIQETKVQKAKMYYQQGLRNVNRSLSKKYKQQMRSFR